LVSAITGEGLKDLAERIEARLATSREVIELRLDPTDGAGISWLHRHTEVLNKSIDENGVIAMTVRADPDKAARLRAKFSVPPAVTHRRCSPRSFGSLRFIPKRVHLGQACLLRGFAAGRECTFYRRKTPLEFQISLPQHRFRVCVEVAREVNHGKQQIADLARGSCFVHLGAIELGF